MIKRIFKFIFLLPSIVLSKNVRWKDVYKISQQMVLIKSNKYDLFHFGHGTTIGNYASPKFFSYSYIDIRSGSKGITIGSNTKIGNNIAIISKSEVIIGDKCLIGNDVKIYDSNFHALSIDRSYKNCLSRPIKIGKNVFIGDNVIILKGTSIGDNSVIGAGSVVSQNVDDNVIVAGNPLRIIKAL